MWGWGRDFGRAGKWGEHQNDCLSKPPQVLLLVALHFLRLASKLLPELPLRKAIELFDPKVDAALDGSVAFLQEMELLHLARCQILPVVLGADHGAPPHGGELRRLPSFLQNALSPF